MTHYFQILFIILAVFGIHTVAAQSAKILNLEKQLELCKFDDTTKVNSLNRLAIALYFNDVERSRAYANQALALSEKLNFVEGKAESNWVIGTSHEKADKALSMEYYQKALKLAQSINFKRGIAKYLSSIGMNHRRKGEKEEAAISLEKAVKIAEEINDKSGLAKYLINLSTFYSVQGKHEQGIKGLQKALGIFAELNDEVNSSVVLTNLGAIYSTMGNYPTALEYYLKSLKIKEKLDHKEGILVTLINISEIYNSQQDYENSLKTMQRALKIAEDYNDKQWLPICIQKMGSIYNFMNRPEALTYLQKSLKMSEELGDKFKIMNTTEGIGDFYLRQKNYEKALEEYYKALKKAQEVDRKPSISDICRKIGTVYMKQEEFDKALIYTQKSLTIAQEYKMLKEQELIHYQLSQIDSANNNYKEAYINYKLYKKYTDSIYNEKNVKKLTELELNFNFEKEKEKQLALHEAEIKIQKIIIIALVSILILMLLLAVIAFQSYRFKHKTNLILTEQKHEIGELNDEYQAINEELRQSNEQLFFTKNLVEEREYLLNQITDNIPVFISLLNKKHEYLFVNEGYADIFNRTKNEIIGKNVKDILDAESYLVASKHIEKPALGELVIFENILKKNDGGNRIIQTTYLPYYQNETYSGILVCSSDITERKLAEQALTESEAEKESLRALEMKRINNELESNQKAIAVATLKLVQNSERDANTIERLIEIEKITNLETKKSINTLISDYKRASYNSNWEEFEFLFEKVHNSFYENLNVQFPNLTSNERKICAFLKLNMTNKDIAKITFQSEDALKKARLRLRQKLGLDRETNLCVFIQNI